MIWRVAAVGRPKLEFARDGIAEYLKRLKPSVRMETQFVKDESGLLASTKGWFRIVLDEQGTQLSSKEFAKKIIDLENRAISRVGLIVGGADGHSEKVKTQADFLWSLGRLTLQHEMALVLVLEQIYRAYAINSGHPYHRE